jgi:hypothetical protein
MMIFPLWKFLYSFALGGRGIMALGMIFWIWVLVDYLTKEPSEGNDKVACARFILMVPFIGALIYYFVRRPERIKAAGR